MRRRPSGQLTFGYKNNTTPLPPSPNSATFTSSPLWSTTVIFGRASPSLIAPFPPVSALADFGASASFSAFSVFSVFSVFSADGPLLCALPAFASFADDFVFTSGASDSSSSSCSLIVLDWVFEAVVEVVGLAFLDAGPDFGAEADRYCQRRPCCADMSSSGTAKLDARIKRASSHRRNTNDLITTHTTRARPRFSETNLLSRGLGNRRAGDSRTAPRGAFRGGALGLWFRCHYADCIMQVKSRRYEEAG